MKTGGLTKAPFCPKDQGTPQSCQREKQIPPGLEFYVLGKACPRIFPALGGSYYSDSYFGWDQRGQETHQCSHSGDGRGLPGGAARAEGLATGQPLGLSQCGRMATEKPPSAGSPSCMGKGKTSALAPSGELSIYRLSEKEKTTGRVSGSRPGLKLMQSLGSTTRHKAG